MPQPDVLDHIQQPLIDAYKASWLRVQAEQQDLVDNPLAYRRRTRLTDMRRTIEGMMKDLDAEAGDWIANQLPKAYLAGLSAGGGGAAEAVFTQVHTAAVQELSKGLFDELLAATQHVNDTTKQLVRAVAQDEALSKAIEGKTANQAATEMRRILEGKSIHAVRYSDGSRHGLAEYTQVAMRTTTAKAYNSGTLNSALDVKFWEIFDGPLCGLSFHDDPTLASGMVVDRDTAAAYTISHPNCRRSFGARPDITRADQASKANPTTTREQRIAQLAQDSSRGSEEALRELIQPSRRDVFSQRQARLDAQKARYAESDRLKREADRIKRQAERDAKLRLEESERAQREAERKAAQDIIDAKLAAEKAAAEKATAKTGLPDGEVALSSKKVVGLDVDMVTTRDNAGHFIHRDGRYLGEWKRNFSNEIIADGRYFDSNKAAAQYLIDKAAKEELIAKLPRFEPPFPTMRAKAMTEEVGRANPGRTAGPSFLNNCHYCAPTMELRARGFDVIAEPTFQKNGRYQHSIAKDWVDPKTGQSRKFTRVGLNKTEVVPGTSGKNTKYVTRELTQHEVRDVLVARTATWPPGARGFITGDWKSGSAHIWNMYKDEAGVLRFVDGQVNMADVESYLGRIKEMQILRVDDLAPTERLLQTSRSADEGVRAVTKVEQIATGLRQLAQMYDDYGDSGFYAHSYQVQMDKYSEALRKLGVKDPYTEAQKLRKKAP